MQQESYYQQMIKFDNSYNKLPKAFFEHIEPSLVGSPYLINFNKNLAEELQIEDKQTDDQQLAAIFSGHKILKGSEPLAMAYSGHQFGHFVPLLGDGRAILLGEVLSKEGKRFDVQLKGAGQTPYSRRGDGRSSLGPVIREYILSEAMFALGVPTTRALAAVLSGEEVFREKAYPGGVFTRVASSHIRVGTFEYVASLGNLEELKSLADYVTNRHYPELKELEGPEKYNQLFLSISDRKLNLVAKWMGLGFIHGVMNTDNTSVSVETIDYGPCAFMDEYSPNKVFSSIDRRGRYAYSNQGKIALWNLSVLANSLLPLLRKDHEDIADTVARVQETFDSLAIKFEQLHLEVMVNKLGFFSYEKEDEKLLSEFLQVLEDENLDFTNSFRQLSEDKFVSSRFLENRQYRLDKQGKSLEEVVRFMNGKNPFLIPRNHQVERAIADAYQGDFKYFRYLVESFKDPYNVNPELASLTEPPKPEEVVHQTFCGT
jgi:uncharacterized protein YdiU (UPF0061 family)